MRGRDRKTICFKHIREHRGQAMFTTGSSSSQTFTKSDPSHECEQPNFRSINDRICFLFTMTDSTAVGARRSTANSIHPRTRASRRARRRQSAVWWSQTGSNRRPHACKARALPTELWPLASGTSRGTLERRPQKWWAWEDLNFRPHAYQARALTN